MKDSPKPPTWEENSEMISRAFQNAAPIPGGSNLEAGFYTDLEERKFGNFGEPSICANCSRGDLDFDPIIDAWKCDHCGWMLTMTAFMNWVKQHGG